MKKKAKSDCSASLPFSICPMHLATSQYLIHLVKFTNIQPRNNIIKKRQKQKNQNISILTTITNLTSRNVKLI